MGAPQRLCAASADGAGVGGARALLRYADCADGAETWLYIVEGGRHGWPGTPSRSRSEEPVLPIDANELLWAFLSRHSLAP